METHHEPGRKQLRPGYLPGRFLLLSLHCPLSTAHCPLLSARPATSASTSSSVCAAPTAWLEALGWQLYSVRGNFDEYRHYVAALAKSFNDPILGPQFGRLIKSSLGSRWVPVRMEQRRPITAGLPRGSSA